MTDPRQIPFLIELLEEESAEVQGVVLRELASFGPILKNELDKLPFPMTTFQRDCIDFIFQDQKRGILKQRWTGVVNALKREEVEFDCNLLEKALSIINEFLSDREGALPISRFLDNLASEYRRKYHSRNERTLALFLFQQKALRGNEKDYYNPQNSNLSQVIIHKRGIPISLACIYILVGHRLGLNIEGCHFPGHFLARIFVNKRKYFVDCFNGGQIIRESDIIRIRENVVNNIENILAERASTESIIRRFLANLIRSFQIEESEADSDLFIELFQELDLVSVAKNFTNVTPSDIIRDFMPKWQIGEIVCHSRYGYRGIVVDYDTQCEATDDWYYSNQSQPNRHQPWYHILVHGSDQVTYVAENNLGFDSCEDEIVHPWVSYFFDLTEDGIYVRNDNPWPEADI